MSEDSLVSKHCTSVQPVNILKSWEWFVRVGNNITSSCLQAVPFKSTQCISQTEMLLMLQTSSSSQHCQVQAHLWKSIHSEDSWSDYSSVDDGLEVHHSITLLYAWRPRLKDTLIPSNCSSSLLVRAMPIPPHDPFCLLCLPE